MAVLHMDDFAGYGNATESQMLAGVYAGLYSTNLGSGNFFFVDDPDGISGKKVLKIVNSGQNVDNLARFVLPSSKTTIGMFCRVWFPALPTQGYNIPFALLAAGTTHLYTMTISATGRIEIRTGDHSGAITWQSTGPAITAQGWWHIEWKFSVDATTGSFEVRVEGVPVPGLQQTNVNTGTTAIQQVAFGQNGVSGGYGFDHYVKDLVIWDTTGDYANDFLGTCILHRHSLQDPEVANWDLTGNATRRGALSNRPPTNSQYISAEDDPIPGAYQVAISPLPEDVVSVKAVQIRYMAAKNDGGDAKIQAGLVSDPLGVPAEWDGTERVMTIAQLYYSDYNHTDPKTNAPWIPGALDDAHVTINRTL